MEYAAIIAGVISAITSLVAMGQEQEAAALRQRIVAQYGPEILPDLDKAIAQEVGPSALATMDDKGRQIQGDIDTDLAEIYDTAGNTPADEAAYDVARRSVSQRASQRSGENAMSVAQRGQAGGQLGSVLAAQSGQSELDALAGLNAEVASSARNRAMQALSARAGNAAQMRGGDMEKASATDLMNRFNASQRQGAEMYNVGLPQQQFDNDMLRRQAQAAAINGQASGYERAADGTRAMGAGAANSAMSYGQAYDWSQDPDNKKGKK